MSEHRDAQPATNMACLSRREFFEQMEQSPREGERLSLYFPPGEYPLTGTLIICDLNTMMQKLPGRYIRKVEDEPVEEEA